VGRTGNVVTASASNRNGDRQGAVENGSQPWIQGDSTLENGVDRQELERALCETFDDGEVAAVVARQAGDIADDGQFDADFGGELTVETVIENLQDAPAEYSLAERWNWWLGALDLSHGGYTRFSVRPDVDTRS